MLKKSLIAITLATLIGGCAQNNSSQDSVQTALTATAQQTQNAQIVSQIVVISKVSLLGF